ncbi:MAG TPA: hypothetical protein DIC34_06675 [Treponema sp.]|nr:MAG: hypothetical protein A2Y36_17615 [Treponema sp. GWA1_62_8]OHE67077.1 MAG: hypothetical protein A2001_02480 [Treponema sp. GWC1_61_84]OHE75243.1 MAG: hypothetical protein A2413_00185 [Treponema sp. RIFOXYC1_FULL_61_9]HCM26215.1 hypothetical protein [Treponema sp.]
MKIKRSWLLAATASLGAALILYTIARQAFGLSFGEAFENNIFNGILIMAVGLMVLNRKLSADEKKELEAKKAADAAALADAAAVASGAVPDESEQESGRD